MDTYNGQADDTPSDFQVQIDWGDGGSSDSDASLVSGGTDGDEGFVLVKASHIYTAAGTFDVTVTATGPDGQSVSDQTTTVTASRCPTPPLSRSRPPPSTRGPSRWRTSR